MNASTESRAEAEISRPRLPPAPSVAVHLTLGAAAGSSARAMPDDGIMKPDACLSHFSVRDLCKAGVASAIPCVTLLKKLNYVQAD